MKEHPKMVARTISKALPLVTLCCTMGALITASLWGWPVSSTLMVINGAGLVLAIFNCLDPNA